MKIAITGGTGFLGSALARHFAARGDEVRLIIRSTSRRDRIPAAAAARVADITNAAQMRVALAGAEARAAG